MTKILVIEDEPRLRDNIVDLLEIEEYEVESAENGRVGVDMLKNYRPDLILCDVMMPELDGYGVLRELRANPETATIPFIFLTALADKDDTRRGMNMGADDYVVKPFSYEDLVQAVESRLERRAETVQHQEQMFDELRKRLSQVIPHELRTPLVAVLGFSNILLEDWKSTRPEIVDEMLGNIQSAGKRLERFIENYGLFAQLQLAASREEDRAKMFPLDDTVNDPFSVLEGIARELAAKYERPDDLELKLSHEGTMVPVQHIRKIAEELIDNAFKFSGSGDRVRIGGFKEDGMFSLVVEDQGRGMTRDVIARTGAFMQFEREKYEQQGLGLGLTVVKGLVDVYRGTLQIDGRPDEGSRVKVELPLARTAIRASWKSQTNVC